ncbi:divalent-cation tolerance protein CutA [Maridesulfovibrio bastinii]|uniref:divalent-cation tolerance protein CutA n=1 Tax=Maridesulfovibrio bastinii TaxID=47157 RepID=UPI0004101242|nr:divalent-cation tolerance protein CutA [Maridesulfovibrio bastinii]
MDISIIYITAPDIAEARSIGAELMKQRLVACVNMVPSIESMFFWDGELRNENEVLMVAKTKKELVPKLTAAVKEIHSYECPCIVAFDISGGNSDFLEWVGRETQ